LRLLCGFEVAVDGDEDILVETGITTDAGFGVKTTFENTEIVLEEAKSPFEGDRGVVMFEGMGTTLGFFDEFAIGYAGSRPGLGKVVSIELKEAVMLRSMADNDVFAVFVAFFDGVHGSPIGINHRNRTKIAHSTSTGSGIRG